jgi:predicted nucleic acid-binding protein
LINGERQNVRLVADANALLSAVLGGRAKLIVEHPEVEEILTAAPTFAEVEEYAEVLARKKRIPTGLLLLAVAALPVTVIDRPHYSSSVPRARKLIGRRDPDDVDILALALHHRLPLWSNDKDFEGTGVQLLTTETLLRQLKII